ncbi:MAG: glycosyltransferase family 2 protein [Elusimicrobia bacterium]|nr:glycosyltransferase family 2 protein [Elusimicrobiota bacterium]
MKNPRLTIAVVTYNRSRFLRETLACLGALVESEGGGETELLVCDNASTDGTRELLDEFVAEHDFARVRIGDQNRGFDGNILAAWEGARGDFVWFFADDDLLRPSAIAAVRRVIAERAPAYIFVNYGVFSKDMTHRIDSLSPACRLPTDTAFDRGEDALRRLKMAFFFLNANVVNKRLLGDAAGFRRYDGSAFMHVVFALTAMQKGSAYCLAGEMIRQRGDNSSGGGESFIRGVRRMRDCARSLGYARSSVNSIADSFLWGAFKRGAQIGAAEGGGTRHLAEFRRSFADRPLFWLLIVPISLCPRWILAPTRVIFKKLHKTSEIVAARHPLKDVNMLPSEK